MSFSTSFQHMETTILPLPYPKPGISQDEIADKGLEVALSLLQDLDFMMDLAPLHICHEKLSPTASQAVDVQKLAADFNVALSDTESSNRVNGGADWQHFEIRDQVPVMFKIKKEITFQTALRCTETGMESLSDPGNSVTIHGRYDVARTQNDPSTLTLVECSTTRCNVMLSWYIRANLGSTHAEIHKTIKAKFVELMQQNMEVQAKQQSKPQQQRQQKEEEKQKD